MGVTLRQQEARVRAVVNELYTRGQPQLAVDVGDVGFQRFG